MVDGTVIAQKKYFPIVIRPHQNTKKLRNRP